VQLQVDVLTSIEIDRPSPEVAAYSMDPDNATSWYRNIERVEWKSPKPLRVGTRLAFVARFLGRRIAYTYEVMELAPNDRFVMATIEGPFPMATSYEWRGLPSGATRMALRNRGRPSGFGAIAAPVMQGAMRRANRADLERLKEILEAKTTS